MVFYAKHKKGKITDVHVLNLLYSYKLHDFPANCCLDIFCRLNLLNYNSNKL